MAHCDSTIHNREAVRIDGKRVPISETDVDDICLVTVRAAPKPQNATRDMLAIIAEFATVSLITTELSNDSPIRGQFDFTEVDSSGTAPGSVFWGALRFFINQLRLCFAIARHDAEVIWFFGATAYILPVLTARLCHSHVILQPRGDVPLTLRLTWEESLPDFIAEALADVVRMLERINFQLVDGIVTYSPSMAETLGLDPDASHVSCLGSRFVDLDRFRIQSDLKNRDRVVGFIGRLAAEKGIDTLVDVISHLPNNVTFVFVGDGPDRETIERELSSEIDSNQIKLVGWIDHEKIPLYLNQFRLLVMPSEPTEGLPTTIAEAFACGTPVYTTPVAGIPDLVVDQETGFHITTTDPSEMAKSIELILEQADLSAISKRCRKIAEERYSHTAAVARYKAIVGTFCQT